jgi:hypothetical protein
MNEIRIHIVRFIGLVLAQVLIFNHIHFLGYINPYPYILFIAFFPFNASKIALLLFSFLLGLMVDVFSDGGGVNALACTMSAYARPLWLRISFGIGIEYNTVKIEDTGMSQKIMYLSLLVLTHHFIFYSLEIFSFTQWGEILKKTLYSGVFTVILGIIFSTLFNRKQA